MFPVVLNYILVNHIRVDISWLFVCVDPAVLTWHASQMSFSVIQYSAGTCDTWQPDGSKLELSNRSNFRLLKSVFGFSLRLEWPAFGAIRNLLDRSKCLHQRYIDNIWRWSHSKYSTSVHLDCSLHIISLFSNEPSQLWLLSERLITPSRAQPYYWLSCQSKCKIYAAPI